MQKEKRKHFFSVFPLTAVLILLSAGSEEALAAGPRELVPVGKTVGVTLDTKGLLVLGTGTVAGEKNKLYEPCKGVLQAGDSILAANGKTLENKEIFRETVENSCGEKMRLVLERDGRKKEVEVTPVFSAADHAYRIGAWVRDSIQGIGTVTYYDPNSDTFGALGHGVYDVDTGKLMTIREGALVSAELTEIIRGQKGSAGELSGAVDLESKIAAIEKNTAAGIFGSGCGTAAEEEVLPVAEERQIQKGEAVILSDLEGGGVKAYEVQIEDVDRNAAKDHKDMTIRITDKRLLKLTGGIVQGMSGSPVIQNGRIVGAVTHVLVNDPTRGYGIFIENMLEAAK